MAKGIGPASHAWCVCEASARSVDGMTTRLRHCPRPLPWPAPTAIRFGWQLRFVGSIESGALSPNASLATKGPVAAQSASLVSPAIATICRAVTGFELGPAAYSFSREATESEADR